MSVTVAEARRIISNNGSHRFPDSARVAALSAVEELRREGHALSTSDTYGRGEPGHHELLVTHYLTCLRCVGARGARP